MSYGKAKMAFILSHVHFSNHVTVLFHIIKLVQTAAHSLPYFRPASLFWG